MGNRKQNLGTARSRRTVKVRMEDVARHAGVAPMTVSRAINQSHLVTPATLAQVERAIAETGYVPNRVAGSLASRQSRIIAAVNPTLKTSVFADLLHGMWDLLEPAGYQLQVGMSEFSRAREERLIRGFLSQRVDGLLLTGIDHSDAARSLLREWQVPVVEIFDFTDDPIDMLVGFSAVEAGAVMAKHLAERGYGRVGVLRAPATSDRRSERRADGFIATCRVLGIECRSDWQYRVDTLDSHSGAATFKSLITSHPELDAVFSTNDTLAIGALLECQRMGLEVPKQIAISGIGDLEISGELAPSLTTVRIRSLEMGRKAAELLLAAISGDRVEQPIVDIGVELVEREST